MPHTRSTPHSLPPRSYCVMPSGGAFSLLAPPDASQGGTLPPLPGPANSLPALPLAPLQLPVEPTISSHGNLKEPAALQTQSPSTAPIPLPAPLNVLAPPIELAPQPQRPQLVMVPPTKVHVHPPGQMGLPPPPNATAGMPVVVQEPVKGHVAETVQKADRLLFHPGPAAVLEVC